MLGNPLATAGRVAYSRRTASSRFSAAEALEKDLVHHPAAAIHAETSATVLQADGKGGGGELTGCTGGECSPGQVAGAGFAATTAASRCFKWWITTLIVGRGEMNAG